MKDIPNITTYSSNQPGPTVAIFAGVHGDEPVGLLVQETLKKTLKLEAGTLHLVKANPRAIKQATRYTEKNLNRSFIKKATYETYEEKCAEQLMDLLDTCDALLDLHAYTCTLEDAIPFAITELNAAEFIASCPIPYVISNIDSIEKGGSDGYMSNQGKVGICIELGAKNKPEQFVDLGLEITERFLSYFGLIAKTFPETTSRQTIMRAADIYFRANEDFSLAKPYKTFDLVEQGELIATDGGKPVVAKTDCYLLFPSTKNPVGVEAFLTAIESTLHS